MEAAWRPGPGGVHVVSVKGHATDADVSAVRRTPWQRACNDHADHFAKRAVEVAEAQVPSDALRTGFKHALQWYAWLAALIGHWPADAQKKIKTAEPPARSQRRRRQQPAASNQAATSSHEPAAEEEAATPASTLAAVTPAFHLVPGTQARSPQASASLAPVAHASQEPLACDVDRLAAHCLATRAARGCWCHKISQVQERGRG